MGSHSSGHCGERGKYRALGRVRSLLRLLIFLAKPPSPDPHPTRREATLPDVAPPSLWGRGGSRAARAGRGYLAVSPPSPDPCPHPTRREGEQVASGFLPSPRTREGMPT